MRLIDKHPFLLVILRACSQWEQTPETDDVTLPRRDVAPGIALLFMGRWVSDSGQFSSVGMAVPGCPSDSKTLALGTLESTFDMDLLRKSEGLGRHRKVLRN